MLTRKKGRILKKIFCLGLSVLFLQSQGCQKDDVKGLTPAFIYPNERQASIRKILSGNPLRFSDSEIVPIEQMNGWVCLPREQVQFIRRRYLDDLQAAQQEENIFFVEAINGNSKLRISKAAN